VEISQAKLSGSLRVGNRERKAVIYFRDGKLVYGVSNARSLRLFSILLNQKRVQQKSLASYPNFENDLELSAALVRDGLLSPETVRQATVSQIEAILVDVLTWETGEWVFSPLARLRDDLVYDVNTHEVLMQYARCVSAEEVYKRFKSIEEAFDVIPGREVNAFLQPHESVVLSRFTGKPLTIQQLRLACPMPDGGMIQALYVLWLGGILQRRDWNAAFSPVKIGQILTAKVSLVREAAKPEAKNPDPQIEEKPAQPEAAPAKLTELEITLEEYLKRVEDAETFYDVLGVAENADGTDLKSLYFGLAKLFHPDRYHREETGQLRRIQSAFTHLAQAYETLKDPQSRETYDFKIRKELEAREKRRAEGRAEKPTDADRQTENGLESFEQGLSLLADEEYGAAATHLQRAVHYNPNNALFRAYLGKVLSVSKNHRHQAEAELQHAVKLEPKNAKIRLMLVEFFLEMNMRKRAEGELRRFLELVPGNSEARSMLDNMQAQVGEPL
jgi:curved DNA-binding protein CbpA